MPEFDTRRPVPGLASLGRTPKPLGNKPNCLLTDKEKPGKVNKERTVRILRCGGFKLIRISDARTPSETAFC